LTTFGSKFFRPWSYLITVLGSLRSLIIGTDVMKQAPPARKFELR
jgi:hypothetical protein